MRTRFRKPLLYPLSYGGANGRVVAILALQPVGADTELGWRTTCTPFRSSAAACGLVRGPYARFPPEPVRYVGGRLVRAAVARKERLEDAGRKPDPVTTRLAALAAPVFVPAPRGPAASAR